MGLIMNVSYEAQLVLIPFSAEINGEDSRHEQATQTPFIISDKSVAKSPSGNFATTLNLLHLLCDLLATITVKRSKTAVQHQHHTKQEIVFM